MIRSMTGFGRAQEDVENFKLTVEVVSLNSRFLDLHIYLPECLEHMEGDIRSVVQSSISRGLVKVRVKIDRPPDFKVRINTTLLKGIVEEIQKSVKGNYTIDLASLLSLPGVLVREEDIKFDNREKVMEVLKRALEEMIKSREIEGEKIKKDVITRLRNIKKHLKKVEQLKEVEIERRKEKVRESFEKLKEEVGDDPQFVNRISSELVFWANKLDVNEEISRIRAHIKNIENILKNSREPVGRKLDFYAQELHREITTLSNKSVDVNLINHTILMREEVERIKEQVRNIE